MAATVELIDPTKISPNPDNPRLIFRVQELDELEQSIASQGILVPLAVYTEGRNKFILLDGERRWRCARKLGLHKVPAIIQPKPQRVQNIMMMFAIHNARRDWLPLPTALKLQELEKELSKGRTKKITEAELAASASLSRGAVRRYRKILRIPKDLQRSLLHDLESPGGSQSISVDQVIEAVDAAEALSESNVIAEGEERGIIDAIVRKFRDGVIKNTVEPRRIVAVARFVRKGTVPVARARSVLLKFSAQSEMTIGDVAAQTIERLEEERSVERSLKTFEEKLLPKIERSADLPAELRERIRAIIERLRALL